MNILQSINDLLLKYPAMSVVMVLALFSYSSYQSYETKINVAELSGVVETQTYDYSYRLLERGLAGADSGNEVLDQTRFWRTNGWDAQLTAIDTLCEQPQRLKLLELTDHDTGVNMCRISR
jgi:hypothetical protein